MTAAAIAKALKGQRTPSGWLVCCPAHNDRNPSLLLGDGENGKLLCHCYAGCDGRDVLAAIRSMGLLDGDEYTSAPTQPRNEPNDEVDRLRRIEYARKLWRETHPAEDSPVAKYLANRGYAGPIPPTLRYHGALKHKATGLTLPGMVAAVAIAPASQVVAIHRTFLTFDGRKAPVSNAKAMLGPCGGGAVRLAAAGPALVISEGIETGLSVMLATGLPTWAALSAGGIEGLTLPALPLAAEVTIAADNDPSGRGQAAADKAAARFTAEGRRVRICMPPTPGSDFNDVLTKEAH